MAADLTQTLLGKHYEKLVLLAAVLVLVGAGVYFIGMRPNQNTIREEVDRSVKDTKAKAGVAGLDEVLSKDDRVLLGIDEPALTVNEFEVLKDGLPLGGLALTKMVMPAPGERKVGPTTTVTERVAPPSKVQPVESIEVAVGRGSTTDTVPNPLARLDVKTPISDMAWVGCVGRVDLTAQLEEFLAGWEKGGRQPIMFTRVDLQRRELRVDGTWSEWKIVPPAGPAAVLAKMPKAPANSKDVPAVQKWYFALKDQQAAIRRLPFFKMVAEDPNGKMVEDLAGPVAAVEQPDLRPPAPPKPAEEGAPEEAPAEPAPPPPPTAAAGGIWVQPSAKSGAEAAAGLDEAKPHVYATVWANDASVEPGHTYQYQMRVAIVNPVYSNEKVENEAARWALELAGPWSDPTAEVTVPNLVEFYFASTSRDKANLELHRWIFSQWVVAPSVQRSVGTPIDFLRRHAKLKVPGSAKEEVVQDVEMSPGSIIVDILRNFPYQPEGNNKPVPTNFLIYADAQGRLFMRNQWDDSKEATNKRIQRQDEAAKVRSAKTPAKGAAAPVPPPPAPKPTPTPKPKPKPPVRK